MPEVDICVGDPIHVEFAIFKLWLKGSSALDASRVRESQLELGGYEKELRRLEVQNQAGSPDMPQTGIVFAEINDQFLCYSMLETFLVTVPPTLDSQAILPLPPNVQQHLIQMYYSFDEHHLVIRELLGKKLTGRTRGNLDDVAEKTGVLLKSCRRQFDNVRRVFRLVEDKPGNLVENIRRGFLLPTELATKYASIVFMANCKFETGKKRLSHLPFHDFHVCVEQMIDQWTVGAEAGEQDQQPNVDTGVDRLFLHDLRDVRNVVEQDIDVLRSLASIYLASRFPDHSSSSLEAHFKQLNKTILKMAESLVHKTELKDFFSDLEEKCIDPCRQWEYSPDQMCNFISAMLESCKHLEQLTKRRRTHLAYEKYLKTVHTCVYQFASARKR